MSRQARILLVDDRTENLVALEAVLSSMGQILVPVCSGEQAVAAVQAADYAVVLLDVIMPGMDGFETAALIRRQARSQDVPIIFLTAAIGQPEQAFRSYAAGAVDYLAKPFDPWVLKAKVSVFVDLYLKRSEPALDQLGAVEETLAELRRLPAVRRDAAAAEAAAQLAGRVGQLREALDGTTGLRLEREALDGTTGLRLEREALDGTTGLRLERERPDGTAGQAGPAPEAPDGRAGPGVSQEASSRRQARTA